MGVLPVIRVLIILALLLFAGLANAQMLMHHTWSSTGGGAVIPPSCNNSFDFSQACNSVYLGIVR